MSRKILENFMVDSYSRREGESEEREAIKRLLCEQIDKKIDEEVRKSRIENEIKKILEDNKEDKKNQEEVRQMINERSTKWYLKVWEEGYLCYKLKRLPGEDKRRQAIKTRMTRLKRIRPAIERYRPIGYSFLPTERRLILDISEMVNIKRGFVGLVQMINYYCDNYSVYQYSPLPGTGYKYYSGERIIVYFINIDFSEKQIEKIVDGAKKDETNGFNLKTTYKIIINASKWRGCQDWRREMIIDKDTKGDDVDFRIQMLLAWKGCRSMEELNEKYHFLNYCKKKGLEPWPFKWHEPTGLELI